MLLSHPYSFLNFLPTYLKNPQCGRNRVLLHLTLPSINSRSHPSLYSRPVDTSVNPQLPMTRHVPNQLGYPSESSMEPYRHPSRGPPVPPVHERAYLVSRPNPRIDPHIRPPPRANSAPHVTSNAASSPRRRIPVAVCLSNPLPYLNIIHIHTYFEVFSLWFFSNITDFPDSVGDVVSGKFDAVEILETTAGAKTASKLRLNRGNARF